MIHKFAECIYKEDPTFITGFNDSSFDWPFLKQKLEYYSDPSYYSGNVYKKKNPANTELVSFTKKIQGVVRVGLE